MSRITGCGCDWYMLITRLEISVISEAQSDNNVLTAFFSISQTSCNNIQYTTGRVHDDKKTSNINPV